MQPPLQTCLENERAILVPLKEEDFEELYAIASDPLIWEQHPNKDRWQEAAFRNYFEGAMKSGGAFRIVEKGSGEIAGCTRFYGYNEEEDSIHIGYTFFARKHWGTGLNHSVKALMLDHAFTYLAQVDFHIGASNLRSQIAIERMGAQKVGELELAYYGEPTRLNFVYSLTREEWQRIKPASKGKGNHYQQS